MESFVFTRSSRERIGTTALAIVVGGFNTPDPFGGSESPADPQSWNRYEYAVDDPINRNDPNGLCPPGYVPATTAQLQGIVNTAESYTGQQLTHADNTHYVDPGGVLSAIDCTGLIAQALAAIAYVRAGVNRGQIRPGTDPCVLADLIISCLEGSLMISRLERSDKALRNARAHLEEHLETNIRLLPV